MLSPSAMEKMMKKKEKDRRSRRHRKGKIVNSEEGEERDVKTKDER